MAMALALGVEHGGATRPPRVRGRRAACSTAIPGTWSTTSSGGPQPIHGWGNSAAHNFCLAIVSDNDTDSDSDDVVKSSEAARSGTRPTSADFSAAIATRAGVDSQC
jgi:hypothetical protein